MTILARADIDPDMVDLLRPVARLHNDSGDSPADPDKLAVTRQQSDAVWDGESGPRQSETFLSRERGLASRPFRACLCRLSIW